MDKRSSNSDSFHGLQEHVLTTARRRIPLPDRTIFTLYDYRKRHATYRTDLDLQLSHSTFPW